LCKVANNAVRMIPYGKRHSIVLSWGFPLRNYHGFNFGDKLIAKYTSTEGILRRERKITHKGINERDT